MRYFILLIVACYAVSVATAAEIRPAVGETVADLRFKDVRALPRSLADLGKKQAFVFAFTTTNCPLVRRSMPKLIDLDARFGPRGVQFVSVNVGPDETIRDMASQAIEFEASFPFVKDADFSCARSLGATRTPEVVVLNSERKIVYRGRIDDQVRLGGSRLEPTRRDLEEALNDVLAGREVVVSETSVDGCLLTFPGRPPLDLHPPTFNRDVAPILNRCCAECHRDDGVAPFSLVSYPNARSHAEMVAEVVVDQRMPPWYASPKHGKFRNDPSLTPVERHVLLRWVASDRLEGDPGDAPKPRSFLKTDWKIGEPDLVISMIDEHQIPATGYVDYKRFLLPYVFMNETWLEAIEIRPDNRSVVHHCNMAYATTDGVGHKTFITGHVPGGQPMDLSRFDEGVAFKIPQFAVLGLEVHYTTTGKEERCRISVGLRFPRKTIHKRLQNFLLDPHGIAIEPGHGAFPIRSSVMLTQDVTLLGLFAHMHLRGKDMTFFADVPNQPRQTLLQIPNYNFGWQLAYEIAPGVNRFPAGTRIEALAHYDNSSFNPYNPDPGRVVRYGQQTFDEMFNGYGFFVDNHENLGLTVDSKTGVVRSGRLGQNSAEQDVE